LKLGRTHLTAAGPGDRRAGYRSIRAICRLCGIFAFLWLVSSVSVFALDVPPLKGRVNDYAGMISPATERLLEAALQRIEDTESTQIVVLTIPTLAGDALEDFSIRVALSAFHEPRRFVLRVFRLDAVLRFEERCRIRYLLHDGKDERKCGVWPKSL